MSVLILSKTSIQPSLSNQMNFLIIIETKNSLFTFSVIFGWSFRYIVRWYSFSRLWYYKFRLIPFYCGEHLLWCYLEGTVLTTLISHSRKIVIITWYWMIIDLLYYLDVPFCFVIHNLIHITHFSRLFSLTYM